MAGDIREETNTNLFGASLQSWVSIYLKGFAMGSADSVPGVSGGTIAFIVGIYERLITAISELDPMVVFELRRVHTREGRTQLYRDLLGMDVPFLVVLGTGAISALVVVSRVVHAALTDARALTFAFFFGLIAASVVIFYDQVAVDTPGRIGAALSGFAIAFFISGITTESSIPHVLPIIFLAGMIAICATILPGVSGAFFLLLFGQYEYLSGVLKSFVDNLLGLVVGDASLSSVVDPALTVVAFGIGATVGLLSMARIIRQALDSYRTATLAFLVSLMVGALRLPVQEMYDHTPAFQSADSLASAEVALALVPLAVAAVAGGVAVLLLERYTGSLDY